MPTATPASAPSAAERRRGLKPSKKTKGNDGASKGGATTRADKSGVPKGKGIGCSPPSPERKNLESNKRQQQASPVTPPQRSASRKGSKDSTQPITAFFPGGKATRNQPDQKNSASAKSLPFKAHAANNAPKDVPKLSVAEQTRKRVEAVRAQRESAKEAAMVKVAREVEEKELKRKEAIKETELSFMGHGDSVTDPSGVLDSGDQQEHGDRVDNVTMGVRGENEESASEGGSKNSLQVDDMTLGSGDVGNDSLSLTSEQQSMEEYHATYYQDSDGEVRERGDDQDLDGEVRERDFEEDLPMASNGVSNEH